MAHPVAPERLRESRPRVAALAALLKLPLSSLLAGLDATLDAAGAKGLVVMFCAMVASFWVSVPIHELLHVLGCVATGGTVWRVEVDPIYGADLLAKVFPFVVRGTGYSGRVSGFDTRGSDLCYLVTDLAPYALTVLVGVPLLRRATLAPRARWVPAAVGAALPLAYAPFLSLTGDHYEMGSILVSRLVRLFAPSFAVERWRSDNFFELAARLFPSLDAGRASDAAGVLAAAALGTLLSFATYYLAHRFAQAVAKAAPMTNRNSE